MTTWTDFQFLTPTCGSWCCLFGLAGLHQGGPMRCNLPFNHEGDHETEVRILVEPKSRFTIRWAFES